jgi:hypothetical protein
MRKFLVTSFLMLVVAAPALAKPKDVYPVSCDDLWAAVKDTLNNTNNYTITSTNDLALRISFTVVGNLTAYTDRVVLTPAEGGCSMQASISEVGPAGSDWIQFHHRLAKSLTKLQAAKPKPTAPATGAQ